MTLYHHDFHWYHVRLAAPVAASGDRDSYQSALSINKWTTT